MYESVIFLQFMFGFWLILGGVVGTLLSDSRKAKSYLYFMIALVFGCFLLVSLHASEEVNKGQVERAEKKLAVGQTYECITEPAQIEGQWYAIVKCKDDFFGLKFSSQPARKGAIVNIDGEIRFLSLKEDGIKISNPLLAVEKKSVK